MKKPNIIFVFADQLRYQSCGFGGDNSAITPNLDKFADNGINLTQAVSSMPVCSAFRASLLTGKYTTSTGMVINELRMNTNHKSIAHCLTEAGYNTGYIGKWHLYSNQLGNHEDVNNSHIPVGADRLGFDGYWAAYNFHHTYYGTYYHLNSKKKIFHKKNTYEPDAQTDMAIKYINKYKDNKNPFYLTLSYGTPHDPWEKNNVPKIYYDMFKNKTLGPSKNYSNSLDPYGDNWSNEHKTKKKIAEWMRVYYAMTTNLDWNFGRLISSIEDAGIIDNTIIIFTSDHGEMFGAHGRMKKNIFYEESIRVPFLIQWRDKLSSGLKLDTLLSTVDIMPTILGLVDVEIPKEVEGTDLSLVLKGERFEEPLFAFLMNTGACAIWEDGHEWRAIRDKKYTYAVYRGSKDLPRKELFFDNMNDPFQLNNLIDNSKYFTQINRFRNFLSDKMNQLNDEFPASSWYLKNWIQNRNIKRTATM
tara:strand:+ start:302 stop:1720 length:1419 start_codon:yes stop_codon:yes gene_type:complete